MFKDVFIHQRHQNSQRRKEKHHSDVCFHFAVVVFQFGHPSNSELFANQLASFPPQMQLIMFRDVFNRQTHQNSKRRKEKRRPKTPTGK